MMKSTTLLYLSALTGALLAASVPAAAAPNLAGQWTCLSYGISVNWFQDIHFYGGGHYALGDAKKPYSPGAYRVDGSNVVHFVGGGDADFLGLYKGGAIYLKFKSDHGAFEKRGYGTITFKCGPDR